MPMPLLHVDAITKRYARGVFNRDVTFSLEADFVVDGPAIVGVMGPNGSGKTTLFELITGSNRPSSGAVRISGQDIHRVRYAERDRLARHYHQSYQVRSHKRTKPAFLLERARSPAPRVHLFDEPQFNTQDGYIGFMLDFFRRLRADGKLVFLCLHPNERWQLDILRECCERFIFVDRGRLSLAADFESLVRQPPVAAYLGHLATADGAR
jgi:ABC-type branched-subunit amino acid transport system ATPase component